MIARGGLVRSDSARFGSACGAFHGVAQHTDGTVLRPGHSRGWIRDPGQYTDGYFAVRGDFHAAPAEWVQLNQTRRGNCWCAIRAGRPRSKSSLSCMPGGVGLGRRGPVCAGCGAAKIEGRQETSSLVERPPSSRQGLHPTSTCLLLLFPSTQPVPNLCVTRAEQSFIPARRKTGFLQTPPAGSLRQNHNLPAAELLLESVSSRCPTQGCSWRDQRALRPPSTPTSKRRCNCC